MASLTELRDILRQSPRASLLSLSLQSHSEPDAVDAMMRVWEKKGRVKRTAPAPSACGGCVAGCSPSQIMFEWLGD